MGKRRHSLNPSKVRADHESLGASPGGEKSRRRLRPGPRTGSLLLNVLSAVLLMVSFAPFGRWYLAYVALVPWALGLIGGASRRWSLACCFVGGLAFWAAGIYWLNWITLPGYVALVVYMALYWLAAGAILRSAMHRRWPAWLVLPVVWVALEYARAWVASGFPWFLLAHSQYSRTPLIQIADVTGQYGVTFFVAMVNGVIVDLLAGLMFAPKYRPAAFGRRIFVAAAAVVETLAALLGYGYWRLSQPVTEVGPVIGVVQERFPMALGRVGATPEKIIQRHMELTEQLAGAGCELIIWPETMLPMGLNPQVQREDLSKLSGDDLRSLAKTFLGSAVPDQSDAYVRNAVSFYLRDGGQGTDSQGKSHTVTSAREHADKLGRMVRKLQCYLLVGGATLHRNDNPVGELDQWESRNSAMWVAPDGRITDIYSKRHLVPFSEYVPFKRSWPWLYGLLRKCVPPQMPQLAPGPDIVRFELPRSDGGAPWRLASPICFEGTFARVCRSMVMADGEKRVDILVNISNDGWFVSPRNDIPGDSTEHTQHLVQYFFRAIENRVPVIRAANTGISASIDSNGVLRQAISLGEDGEAPLGDWCTFIPGTLLLGGREQGKLAMLSAQGPQVLVDRRVSPYSIVGDAFAMVVSLAAILLAVWLVFLSRGRRIEVQEK